MLSECVRLADGARGKSLGRKGKASFPLPDGMPPIGSLILLVAETRVLAGVGFRRRYLLRRCAIIIVYNIEREGAF